MASNNPVFVVQHNHFDPIWRRCWERPFDYLGKRYRPYCELEEYFISVWLENARKGAAFSEGQAVVLRKYLERNPDRLAEMQDLAKKGILELTAAGETVPDTNMPSGETLLRNLVMGQLYFEDTFSIVPEVGWLEDAFGQSAQIPQIYRGCECRSLQRLSYKRVPGSYWKGLDGTVIYTQDPRHTSSTGGGIKIAPCPECSGMGCAKCAYPGLGHTSKVTDEEVERAFANHNAAEPFSLFQIGGEEAVPNPRLPELVEEARQKLGLDIRYGGYRLANKYYADELARTDDPDLEVSDQVEANPVSTGCYVTRIRIKQRFREVENLLAAAEKWAAIGMASGGEYPESCLTNGWRRLLFCAFHDALTSTHIDAAYHELLDMLDEAEHEAWHVLEEGCEAIDARIQCPDDGQDRLLLYNAESWERTDPVTISLSGCPGIPTLLDARGGEIDVLDVTTSGDTAEVTFRPPAIPALGYTAVTLAPERAPVDSGEMADGPGEAENEFFRIAVSETGITSIVDKRTGQEVLDTTGYLGNELVLEEDIGHPWGTMQVPSFEERLGQHTTGVRIRRASRCTEITLTGQYRGADENTRILSWRQSVKLYAGVDRIDFRTDIDWDTAQRRIRVAFPTRIKTDEATYSIPYGSLKRGPYEPDMTGYPSTNGDWPAIDWVDVASDGDKPGLALINTGTPSHKVKDGVIFVSLLRSPTDSWCLNEPQFYDCADFDGARDAGAHSFGYSLVPHSGGYAEAQVERRAREVNNPVIVRAFEPSGGDELPLEQGFVRFDASDNLTITAIKKAHRDGSLVVRIAETAGRPGVVRSLEVLGGGRNAETVNYLERDAQTLQWPLDVGTFKVLTIRLS